MKYVSVCSGIEAATVAWHPLGWEPQLFAEISKFPSAVLQHHYPSVPNVGDFTSIAAQPCDLLVGGTPCQAFSIAGLRGGLADSRGNLALEFMRLADRLRPRWIVWENVPGVLSSNGGRDFGSILGALGELGYGFAYRVLDAQFFGVPQRRRRVFLVGYLGDWRRAAAVLFERESMRRDTPSRRQARRESAPGAAVSVGGSVSHTLKAEGCDASADGTGRGTPVVAFSSKDHGGDAGPLSPTLRSGGYLNSHENGGAPPAIAFHATQDPISGGVTPAISARGQVGVAERVTDHALTCHAAKGGDPTTDNYVTPTPMSVRRLTPRECERLQGFPDDYTLIPDASDTGRYHALGNSMAVPVMRWIGERIDFVDKL